MSDPETTPAKTTPEQITEARQDEWDQQDEEVRGITQTVLPKQDAPPRAGITESGSGADGQNT